MTLDRADIAVLLILVGGACVLVGALLVAPGLAMAVGGAFLLMLGMRNLR